MFLPERDNLIQKDERIGASKTINNGLIDWNHSVGTVKLPICLLINLSV